MQVISFAGAYTFHRPFHHHVNKGCPSRAHRLASVYISVDNTTLTRCHHEQENRGQVGLCVCACVCVWCG